MGRDDDDTVSKSKVLAKSGARNPSGRILPLSRGRRAMSALGERRVERGRTVLLPVHEGDVWRVQIVWPNGLVHYIGRFTTEKEASKWIANHAWWAKNKIQPLQTKIEPP